MLKMSPFITFLLYCLFVSFTIYYLTKDKLDEMSRYMLIGILILPYILMDQSESFSNILKNKIDTEKIENYSSHESNPEPYVPRVINNPVIEQPKITLNENEKVENLKAVEEATKNILRSQDIQNLIKKFNSKKIIEKYGSMYTGEVAKTYNEDEKFTDQSLKPLGENGNGLTNAWDHDYILLNTDKWGPALNPPPVCKTEKTCPVCPNLTTGYPLMLRDFDSSRRVTPPIKADVPSMNNTASNNPTNANSINNNMNESPSSSDDDMIAYIMSFPSDQRPALISGLALQLNMPVELLNLIIYNPNPNDKIYPLRTYINSFPEYQRPNEIEKLAKRMNTTVDVLTSMVNISPSSY